MILFLWVGLKESQPMILILMDICVYISYYSFTGIIPNIFRSGKQQKYSTLN